MGWQHVEVSDLADLKSSRSLMKEHDSRKWSLCQRLYCIHQRVVMCRAAAVNDE